MLFREVGTLSVYTTLSINTPTLTHAFILQDPFSTIDKLQDDGTWVPKTFTELGVGGIVGLWRLARAASRYIAGFASSTWAYIGPKAMPTCRYIHLDALWLASFCMASFLWVVYVAFPWIRDCIVYGYGYLRLAWIMYYVRKGNPPWTIKHDNSHYLAQYCALYELATMNVFDMANIVVEHKWYQKHRTVAGLDNNVYQELYQEIVDHYNSRQRLGNFPNMEQKTNQERHDSQPARLKEVFFPFRVPHE